MPESSKGDYAFSSAQRLLMALFKLTGRLPLKSARAVAYLVARILLVRDGRSVQVTKRNISLCFPHLNRSEHKSLVAQSVRETVLVGLELPLVWQQSEAWFARHVWQREGANLLQQAKQSGKGVLILAPHIGNWEIAGLTLAQAFADDYACLYQPPKQQWFESTMRKARGRFGGESLPTNRKGLVKLSRHIKEGGVTGVLPDQVPDVGSGKISRFYQHNCQTMTLAHSIIKRTHCEVLMMAAIRDEKGFGIVYRKPAPAIYSDSVDESLLAMNQAIEDLISLAPAQYQWEYKRFKRAGLVPKPYADLP